MPDEGESDGEAPASEASALDLPQVIGHRGAAAHAPENTLASIRAARELGASWVEFDVKLTREGIPILMHDDRLERTTDGRGRVRDRTLAGIRRLDAGVRFGSAFAGERVPTLEEALELCGGLGLGINVEIKPCPGRAVATTRAALEVLRERWPSERPAPLISSFTHECLALALELAPELPRGYLCGRVPRDWRLELERYACASLHADHRRIGLRRLALLRADDVRVLLYTVNDAARARTLLAAGAAAVFTDRVGALVDASA